MPAAFIVGLVFLGISSVGITIAVVMEHRSREPKWKIWMKICPWIFGIGALLLALSLEGV